MPEEAPLPVGSAMAVLMPMSRPAGPVHEQLKKGILRGKAARPPGRGTYSPEPGRRHAWEARAETLAAAVGAVGAGARLPRESSSGPPELPGLMAASHWMTLRRLLPPYPARASREAVGVQQLGHAHVQRSGWQGPEEETPTQQYRAQQYGLRRHIKVATAILREASPEDQVPMLTP